MKRPRVFLLLLTVLESTAVQGCISSDGAVNTCSCTFENDTCCWRNKDGNNFNWTRKTEPVKFMSAVAYNSIQSGVARLESSQICASVNVQYSMNFTYRVKFSGKGPCHLSVYIVAGNSTTTIWKLETRSQGQWSPTYALNFTSFDRNFKVFFETTKVNDTYWCQNDIREIHIGHMTISALSTSPAPTTSPSSSSSSTPQSPLPSTTQQPVTSTMPSSAADQTDKDSVPIGAIIGIVIALIVIVVVCVVVIILIRRRGEGREGLASLMVKRFGKLQNKSKAGVHVVPNSANNGKDINISGGNRSNTSSVPRGTVGNGRLQHGTSPYEIPDIPESPNHYGVPVDAGGTHAVRPTNKTKTQSPAYELAAIVESGGDYSTVDDADLEERRARARPDEYAKVRKPKGGNYNKLSFQNPGFDGKAEDTYNHIQDEEPVYKVPRSDGNEYSLATNPGASSVGHSAGGGSEPHYVIVDGKGKDEAAHGGDDEYNHLNLGKDPSANVPDSTDRGTGAGVYNHLDDQNQGPPGVQTEDTYNKVNYDGHTQDQNRKQNAGDYSHIGGF